jgi:hypothetical protein
MPFPLAHPAAVLPLRRYCPRRFNFPALVIGSLCPDIGYAFHFSQFHLDKFSHRLLAGSFGFCLPAGSLLLLMFYRCRLPVVQWLPARHRRIFEPLCLRPIGPFFIIVVSLLVGAWTHIFLDSATHDTGWLVEHLPALQLNLVTGVGRVRVCDALYAICTFTGAIYVAMVYSNWLERGVKTPAWIFSGFKWTTALMFAALTLLLSFANHAFSRDVSSCLGLAGVGFFTALLAVGFFALVGWGLRDCQPCLSYPIESNRIKQPL